MKKIKKFLAAIIICIMLLSTATVSQANAAALGDVNEDEKINSSDALLVLQHSVGTAILEENQKIIADVTGDGRINSSDALIILQVAVGSYEPNLCNRYGHVLINGVCSRCGYIDDYEKKMAQYNSYKATIEEEIAAIEEVRDALLVKINELKSDENHLKCIIDVLDEELKLRELRFDQLNDEAAFLTIEILDVENRLSKLQHDPSANAAAEREALKNDLSRLQSSLTEVEYELDGVRVGNDSLRAKIADSSALLNDVTQELDSYLATVASYDEEIMRLEAELESYYNNLFN